jgi:replicative DNA helicase
MLDGVVTERKPPYSLEAEQALLGAILVANEAVERIAGRVEADDFFDPLHGEIFKIALRMRAEGKAVTPITLRPYFSSAPAIDNQTTVPQYLVKLMVNASSLLNVASYADVIRDQAARRMLWVVGEDAINHAADGAISVREAASLAVTQLDNVLSAARGRTAKHKTAGEAFRETLERATSGTDDTVITTGIPDLDAVTGGGWRRKQYIIVAGRPSMGKTTLATSAMLRTAKAGHGVVFFSLEMPTEQVAPRMLTDLAYSSTRRIAYSDLLAKRISDGDLEALGQAGAIYGSLPMVIEDQRGVTVAEIAARVRAHAQRFERDGKRLGLVVIDHLGFIRATGRYAGSKVNEIGEISEALGSLAKEADVALVVLHQLNRGTEARENKRPTMADLRDSGNLEQDADIIAFTFREAYYLERTRCDAGSEAEMRRQAELEATANTMEVLLGKNRNGLPTAVHLYCDMASNAVRGLAR